MTKFAKASLGIVEQIAPASAREKAKFSAPKDVIDVQFNPTSLSVQYSNSADEGGVTTRAQPRQNPAVQPAILTFDLEFDTAEEPGTDVRTRTRAVRRFVQPPADKPKSPPPLVEFVWGTFRFPGRVTKITETLDYFSPEGKPLRAKLSLSITEQDPSLEANVTGPGARTDTAATDPGGVAPTRLSGRPLDPPPGAGPGRRGTASPAQAVPALEGESLQGLATRLGGNPSAWRSLAEGVGDPLALAAGASIAVGAEFTASAGLGISVGFAAGVAVEADAAQVVATASGVAEGLLTNGMALTAAGGVAAAAGARDGAGAQAAVDAARASFAVPEGAPSPPGEPVDPRQLAYGRSLPLRGRPQVSTAADSRAGGATSLTARARPAEAPVSTQAGAPWERLTPGSPGRAASDAAQRARDARPRTMRAKPGGGCR